MRQDVIVSPKKAFCDLSLCMRFVVFTRVVYSCNIDDDEDDDVNDADDAEASLATPPPSYLSSLCNHSSKTWVSPRTPTMHIWHCVQQ